MTYGIQGSLRKEANKWVLIPTQELKTSYLYARTLFYKSLSKQIRNINST